MIFFTTMKLEMKKLLMYFLTTVISKQLNIIAITTHTYSKKNILFTNDLALRSHREIGSMQDDDTRKKCLSGEQRNFRALLSYGIECCDSVLLTHLETSNKNCTMVSPTLQN